MPELLWDRRQHPDVTYDDAFIVPHNPVVERLFAVAQQDEVIELNRLHAQAEQAYLLSQEHVRKHRSRNPALAEAATDTYKLFREAVLRLAERYPELVRVISRDEVDFRPVDGMGNVPLVIANMTQSTGKRMAETATMTGANAAIPQDKTEEELREIGRYQHSRDVRYDTPIVVRLSTKIHEIRPLFQKRDFQTAIVVDDSGVLVGVISESSIRRGANEDWSIEPYVRRDNLVTAQEGITDEDAIRLMRREHIDFLPILRRDNTVLGALTLKKAALHWRYRPNTSELGGLSMLGTVGAINRNIQDRVKLLIDVGADHILMDTAHLDQGLEVYRNISAVRSVMDASGRTMKLIAGNFVTAQAAKDAFAAGADIGKMGIGPGAMCTTRVETGVGRPQLSVVLDGAEVADVMNKEIWADGGVRYPRDVALALAAGASQVMIGSLVAATYESPGPYHADNGTLYKEGSGMASRQASELRNYHSLERSMRDIFRELLGHRQEGISGAKMVQREGHESVTDIIHWIMDGVTSAMTYVGARSLEEFRRNARIGIQTAGGFAEGLPKHKV